MFNDPVMPLEDQAPDPDPAEASAAAAAAAREREIGIRMLDWPNRTY